MTTASLTFEEAATNWMSRVKEQKKEGGKKGLDLHWAKLIHIAATKIRRRFVTANEQLLGRLAHVM